MKEHKFKKDKNEGRGTSGSYIETVEEFIKRQPPIYKKKEVITKHGAKRDRERT